MRRSLIVRHESWPLLRPFRISRGVKTAAEVIVAEVRDGAHSGQGECVPYARYGESVESVRAQIASLTTAIAEGMNRAELQAALPPSAARNALDCALWDLEAKQTGISAAAHAGVPEPRDIITAVTVSLDAPERMAEAAAALTHVPLIKIKVDADAPLAPIAAVRRAAPNARLIVDPNEGWSAPLLFDALPQLADLRVALIEQPIPAAEDDALEGLDPLVPICADEAAHTSADLERAARRYQAVNIKLDKAGGLTEALIMRRRADELGLDVMIGCMVCTSLAIAPALLLTHNASFADLDGPWWLARDRDDAMIFKNGGLIPPKKGWGR